MQIGGWEPRAEDGLDPLARLRPSCSGACCMLHAGHFACCMLHAAWVILHVACCTLHGSFCMGQAGTQACVGMGGVVGWSRGPGGRGRWEKGVRGGPGVGRGGGGWRGGLSPRTVFCLPVGVRADASADACVGACRHRGRYHALHVRLHRRVVRLSRGKRSGGTEATSPLGVEAQQAQSRCRCGWASPVVVQMWHGGQEPAQGHR